MSKTVDERVVEMRFDNSRFESNVKTSMNTLERLKASMKFDGASKSLEDINKAAKNVSFDGLAANVSNIASRFSVLGIMGKRALENITDSMMSFAHKTARFLTSGVVSGGITRAMNLENAKFQLQGLLKDGQAVSAVMKNVNDAVDGTAYSLDAAAKIASQLAASGMRAGDQMFSSLRAVAGVAAMTNSSYEDIGRIFTQVAGQGRLMGQDLLQLSSRGMNAAATIATYLGKTESEVRDMVSKGQISFEIFANAMDDAFGEHAKKANETFTGAMSNVKASLARIGEMFISPLIVQNGPLVKFFNTLRERINEVKSSIGPLANMFTGFTSNILGGLTKALSNLKPTNYVKSFINIVKSLSNVLKGLWSITKPVGQAFIDIFPIKSSDAILKITSNIKKLTSSFKLSETASKNLKRTFSGLFSLFDIFLKILTSVTKVVGSIFTSGIVTGLLDIILAITASIGDFFTAINKGFGLSSITGIFTGISKIIGGALNCFSEFTDNLSGIGKSIAKIVEGIGNAIKSAFSWITDNFSIGDIFTGLIGGGVYIAIKKIIKLVDRLKEVFSGGLINLIFGSDNKENTLSIFDIGERFSTILDSVNGALQSFTNGIKIGSLLAISGSIAILASALNTISQIKAINITKSLTSIGIMFGMLTISFKSISKTLNTFSGKGVIKAGVSLMLMAESINILADAMKEMSGLSFTEIVKGLIGVGGGVMALALGLKAIDGVKVKFLTIITISVMAKSIKSMAGSLVDLGKMSWSAIGRGITAMGGVLGELITTIKIFEKIGGFKSVAGAISLLVITKSLGKIADALKKIGILSWSKIAHGLTGMGGALAEIAVITGLLGKLSGFSGVLGAASILTVVKSLGRIANALKKIGTLSWSKIAHGLVGMGGALAEIATITGLLGKSAGFSGVLGAASILTAVKSLGKIADALKGIGTLTWSKVAHGLTGMGGALAEIAVITGLLGKLSGFSGLLGSTSILIAVQGLKEIASALKEIGSLSWEAIAHGLVGMGGALAEIAVITGTLGSIAGLPSLLGSGSILLAVQGLGKIADALKKFGEMSWEQIDNGLAAMGSALSEIAVGGLLNTLSLIGSISISAIAESLGTLADSVKKWSGVTVPDGLDKQLSRIAKGVESFKWIFTSGWSLETIAGPLGTLADSVKKWSGVTVPDGLDEQLSRIAKGVESFKWIFTSGWSLETIAGPLGTLADSVKKWDGVTVPANLPTQLETLANGIESFCSKTKYISVDQLSGIISELKRLKTFMSNLAGFDGSGVSSFKAALTTLGTVSVNGLVSSLTGAYGRVQAAAMGLTKAMAVGVNIGKGAIVISLIGTMAQCVSIISSRTTAFLASGLKLGIGLSNGLKLGVLTAQITLIATLLQCVSTLRSYYSSFNSAGLYVASGFANGIKSGSYKAVIAAKAMANAAAKAARKALDEHSPSKVFYAIGSYIPQGMANGIKHFASLVINSVKDMSGKAVSNAQSMMESVSTAINNAANTDIQPFVRPVLDMSDIQNGALQFGTSIDLSLNKPIEMLSNAMYGSQAEIISSNLEVVDAVNGLKSEIVSGVKDAIYDAFEDLAKQPAVIEFSQDIDGRQFAKATVEYYQNEVSKRASRTGRKNGIL